MVQAGYVKGPVVILWAVHRDFPDRQSCSIYSFDVGNIAVRCFVNYFTVFPGLDFSNNGT